MSTRLHTALTAVIDAQVENDHQAALLFNTTPEVDSALERVCALRAHGVPQHVIGQLIDDLVAVYRSNERERRHERTAAGNIDQSLRGATQAITVKGFARSASVLLAGLDKPGAKGVMARRALMRLCAENPAVLAARSLRHEIGASRHDRLMDELGHVRKEA
jgi:hypothetical protein